MQTLLQDFRYATRTLRGSPLNTTVAVLALALGIGANTAIFSVVNAVLLRSLPFREPDRLVVLSSVRPESGARDDVSAADFEDWRASSRTFQTLAAWRFWGMALEGMGEPEELVSIRASANLFQLLGVAPAVGRGFRPEGDQPGRDRVVVLSQGLWQRRFGGDPRIIGRSLTLDGEPYTVVGVMPAGFRFPDDDDVSLWLPLAFQDFETHSRSVRTFNVLGRLAPGATLAQARAEMEGLAVGLARRYPDTNAGWGAAVMPAREALVGRNRALVVLLGAVAFVLAIACANVASLLLARASRRRRELGIRTALGASRLRVVRQLLVESALLGFFGAVLGLVLATWGTPAITALAPEGLPQWNPVSLDATVLLFTLAVSLGAAVLAGVVPALQASAPDPVASLREGGTRLTAGSRAGRVQGGLIVAEVALALVLLVGAGLLLKSFVRLRNADPGFRMENVLVATIFLPSSRYPEPSREALFFEELRERVRRLPGVISEGAVTALPMNPVGIDYDLPLEIEGRPATAGQEPRVDYRVATPVYFRTLGIPLLRGRDFSETDRPDRPGVMIVNRALARRFFPGEDPVGKRVRTPEGGPLEIVGVVGDVRHRGLDVAPVPEMFVPFQQAPHGGMTLVARTRGDPLALSAAVKHEVYTLDPNQPITVLTTLDRVVSDTLAAPRFDAVLLGGFAALALALAVLGIYGMLSYAVSQRTQEIGVRMALGARRNEVVRLVMGRGMALAGAGVALGLAGALALTRVLRGLLHEVSPTDPTTLAATALLLVAVALPACWIPARRATGIDPLIALRAE
jgi:putative ABC transport system permease protein